ncbi:MAG: hypothetical protein QM680_02570 [Luteolibacter sp.]
MLRLFSSMPSASSIASISAFLLGTLLSAQAQDDTRIVFEVANASRAVPVSNLSLAGDQYQIKAAADGLVAGQKIPKSAASHVQGELPADVNKAIALILMEKPLDAIKLLEPIVESQKITAGLPGNHWDPAARATLVAYGLIGSADKCNALGQAISDSTPEPGTDPIVSLGKVLLLPFSTPLDARLEALSSLINESSPAEVSAYASFNRGLRLMKAKRDAEAREAFLIIPCVYPTGGSIINGVAEMNAAQLLSEEPGRREEAVALLTSAATYTQGTPAGEEAEKRLKSLK